VEDAENDLRELKLKRDEGKGQFRRKNKHLSQRDLRSLRAMPARSWN
jgi:hypothetical protein